MLFFFYQHLQNYSIWLALDVIFAYTFRFAWEKLTLNFILLHIHEMWDQQKKNNQNSFHKTLFILDSSLHSLYIVFLLMLRFLSGLTMTMGSNGMTLLKHQTVKHNFSADVWRQYIIWWQNALFENDQNGMKSSTHHSKICYILLRQCNAHTQHQIWFPVSCSEFSLDLYTGQNRCKIVCCCCCFVCKHTCGKCNIRKITSSLAKHIQRLKI